MSRWLVLLGLALLAGCAHDLRDQAITSCRQAGYLSAVESAGDWYCYTGPPLQLTQPKAK